MFKKIILVVTLFLSIFMLTGCGEEKVLVTGSLEELMTKVYSNLPEDKTPMALTNIEVTPENVKNYLGTDIEFVEALARESSVGSIAHSVVLVRVDENADFEAIKTKIKENVNPRKWLCVGVDDEENVVVKNKGNLIILIMTNDGREELEKGFDSL